MKVLVTGGAGFIGTYVVEALQQRNIEPVILDHRGHIADVETFLGDVRDASAVDAAVAETDGVIHLAGVLGTQETIDYPLPSVETNIIGSLNIFQACRRYDLPCSYITVGNYWMGNPYSISKTTAERFAWMFNREKGTRIAVVRALNAYGPRQKAAPVRKIVPNFVLPAIRGEPIYVYGDGRQVMDMIYVADVADIMVRALLADHGCYSFDPQQFGDNKVRFDAGTGRRTTVLEIAQQIIALVGRGSIEHLPMRPGEPEGSVVLGDPETLRPLYDGELPKLLTLEEGLAKTIQYYATLGS